MKPQFIWVLFGLSLLLSKAAQAADKDKGDKDSFGHGMQFGLRGGLVAGYNMIFRYDTSPLCSAPELGKPDKDQRKVCGHSAPMAFDIAASFAPLDFVEPYVFMRLGLKGESETHTLPLKVLGLGARIYTMSDSAFKIFIEPALAWELEGGDSTANPAWQYKKDMLVHLAAGPQLDFARYAGAYLDAGLTTGMLRGLHSELELQLGIQARFP